MTVKQKRSLLSAIISFIIITASIVTILSFMPKETKAISLTLKATLTDATDNISSVAFSPDGAYLAAGSWDNKVRIYYTSNWTLATTLTDATQQINSVAFSPNGAYLATGSNDDKLRIYNTSSWSLAITLTYSSDITDVSWSPDGRYLAIARGYNDYDVLIFYTSNWSLAKEIDIGNWITYISWSQDGTYLAVSRGSSSYGYVNIYNVNNNFNLVISIQGSTTSSWGWCDSAVFSPYGTYLAFGNIDKQVRIYYTSNWTLATILTDATENIYSVAFYPDGRYLAVGSNDDKVRIYYTSNWTLAITLADATDNINSVAFSPDGRYLAVGSNDDKVRIYSLIVVYPYSNSICIPIYYGYIYYNVSIPIENIQIVNITTNASGSDEIIYLNESVGGLNYFYVEGYTNKFGYNEGIKYWTIRVYNGTWINKTFSFYLSYIYDKKMLLLDDLETTQRAIMYKNQSGEYFLAVGEYDSNGGYIVIKKSSNGEDWMNISTLQTLSLTGGSNRRLVPLFFYNYNGNLYLYYYRYDGSYNRMYYVTWNGSVFTGETQVSAIGNEGSDKNAGIIYYNGEYHLFNGNGKRYTGTPPNSWTYKDDMIDFSPAPVIWNGCMYVFYAKSDGVYYRVFDGINWGNENKIWYYANFVSAIKNPISQDVTIFATGGQLSCIIKFDNGNFYYKTLSPSNYGWTTFIDNRTIYTFSSNDRGNYNSYWIEEKDILSSPRNTGGLLYPYNRITFPDATPNQQNVNSSVFYFINQYRNISWMEWKFSDIGQIQCENNIRLWGSTDNITWTNLGTTNANGYINVTTWSGGLPFNVGETRYFKIEILNIGSVAEDLHKCDESIILKVG